MKDTLIDTRLEQKIGFDRIRKMIADRCSTEYASGRVASETFSTNPKDIRKRLLLTDEMRLIVMFEESFPTSGYIDCMGILKPLDMPSSYIDLLSLRSSTPCWRPCGKSSRSSTGSRTGSTPTSRQ